MSDNVRLIIIALIGSLPATIAALTGLYMAWRSSQASKAAEQQSTRNAHAIETVRAATSLTTDRVSQLALGMKR